MNQPPKLDLGAVPTDPDCVVTVLKRDSSESVDDLKTTIEGEASFLVTEHGKKVLRAATKEQLVHTFASETQEVEFINALVLAHEHFLPSNTLMKEFIRYFKSTDDQLKHFRIANIIKKWLELAWRNFADTSGTGLGHELKQFLKHLWDTESPLAGFLQSTMEAQQQEPSREDTSKSLTFPPIISLKREQKRKGKDTPFLLLYDCEEIARQLTLIDYEYFAKIDRNELLKTRWTKPDEAPTLSKAGERTNMLAYWVAYQLISERKLKMRVKLLEHVIKIAQYLLRFKNFNSLMAIYLALNMRPTSKLTQTWKNVKPKTQAAWKKISMIMSPKDNFGYYRDYVQGFDAPFIPCQEIILKDLLYHSEGMDNFVTSGVFDMTKLFVMGKILDQFRLCQEHMFHFYPFPELHQQLYTIRSGITAEELDTLSDARAAESARHISPKMAFAMMRSRSETDSETSDTDSSHSSRSFRSRSSSIGSVEDKRLSKHSIEGSTKISILAQQPPVQSTAQPGGVPLGIAPPPSPPSQSPPSPFSGSPPVSPFHVEGHRKRASIFTRSKSKSQVREKLSDGPGILKATSSPMSRSPSASPSHSALSLIFKSSSSSEKNPSKDDEEEEEDDDDDEDDDEEEDDENDAEDITVEKWGVVKVKFYQKGSIDVTSVATSSTSEKALHNPDGTDHKATSDGGNLETSDVSKLQNPVSSNSATEDTEGTKQVAKEAPQEPIKEVTKEGAKESEKEGKFIVMERQKSASSLRSKITSSREGAEPVHEKQKSKLTKSKGKDKDLEKMEKEVNTSPTKETPKYERRKSKSQLTERIVSLFSGSDKEKDSPTSLRRKSKGKIKDHIGGAPLSSSAGSSPLSTSSPSTGTPLSTSAGTTSSTVVASTTTASTTSATTQVTTTTSTVSTTTTIVTSTSPVTGLSITSPGLPRASANLPPTALPTIPTNPTPSGPGTPTSTTKPTTTNPQTSTAPTVPSSNPQTAVPPAKPQQQEAVGIPTPVHEKDTKEESLDSSSSASSGTDSSGSNPQNLGRSAKKRKSASQRALVGPGGAQWRIAAQVVERRESKRRNNVDDPNSTKENETETEG